eukprot:479161_1
MSLFQHTCWILLVIIWCNMSQAPLKEESCDKTTCEKRIAEVEKIIVQAYGEKKGRKLIEKVKESPENYANDEAPIVVELSNILVDNMISAFSKRDMYNRLKTLEKQTTILKQQMEALETKLDKATKKEEISLDLLGNWVPYHSGYALPKAQKIGNVVYLSGLVKDGSGTITILPEGYRPIGMRIFAVDQHGTTCRMNVHANGDVNPYAGKKQSWVPLDGIQFVVN